MTTIFEALREDHDVQRRLVELLCKTHGDSDGRQQLFERLKDALQRHAAAEERHFYAPLMHHDQTQSLSRHSVAEHHELDEMLEQLSKTEMSAPHWLTKAKTLHERLSHHLDEEEHGFFQVAGKVLSESQKTELASGYRQQMDSAP